MKRTKHKKNPERSVKPLFNVDDKGLKAAEDPEYLPSVRKEYKESSSLEGYCEMLETQIGSLVHKLLYQTSPRDTLYYHPESDSYWIGDEKDFNESNFDGLSERICSVDHLLSWLATESIELEDLIE